MKVLLLLTLLAVTYGARLDNKYLPPPASAASAGGGPGLQGPGGFTGAGGPGRPFGQPNNGLGGFSGAGGPSRPIGPPSGGFGGRPAPGPSQPSGPQIPILSYVNENDGDGNYRFSYETGNGIKAQEEGTIKNKGSQNEVLFASPEVVQDTPSNFILATFAQSCYKIVWTVEIHVTLSTKLPAT
ncbi:pupal cuticle protein 20-like [Teleopsis dalmanni]|uniref:pupal cuticle protein 20-like n=1 Tax=Teleopsis dalmanni TaxID=139649 RepID=UPI0018CFE70B|nr:pupal cuticle protein 20-like [Teleopsis dalmanni]